MFENMDFSKMTQMLEVAQKQAKKMEEDAGNKEFTAKSGGGLVKVSLNGHGEVIDLSIDDSLLEDKESLQILLMSAINDGYKMLEDDKKFSASQMLNGLGAFGK